MTIANQDPARRCARALEHYKTDDTLRGRLIDFLADARHWCDAHAESFAELDRLAFEHFCTEANRMGGAS